MLKCFRLHCILEGVLNVRFVMAHRCDSDRRAVRTHARVCCVEHITDLSQRSRRMNIDIAEDERAVTLVKESDPNPVRAAVLFSKKSMRSYEYRLQRDRTMRQTCCRRASHVEGHRFGIRYSVHPCNRLVHKCSRR